MERLEEFYRNMFCNPKMKEVEILTNSIKLSENDKIICDGENSGKQIRLFSQSLMVINQADGECLQQFYPVRVQSCMDRSKVRIEPVTITELPQNIVQISMLGTTERYDAGKIDVLCKPWSPEPRQKGCGDCSRCRKCWT